MIKTSYLGNTQQVLLFTKSVFDENTRIKITKSKVETTATTTSSRMLKVMEKVARFYSHCDLTLALPVCSRPAAVANPCPTTDFIGLPLEPTAEGWP